MSNLELFIEENWGLSEVEVIKTIQVSGGREVLLIKTYEGLFVVKIFDKELEKDLIIKYTDILLFLENNQYSKSPKLIKLPSGKAYDNYCDSYIYILEYIDGDPVTESLSDEYALGKALANLHKIDNYAISACIDIEKSIYDMLNRFHEHSFKNEYDEIVKVLPDFNNTRKCFIHTDVCPKNALKNKNGEIVFLDFDDAGNGPLFTDLGYPLITQFVQFVGREDGGPVPNPEKLYCKYDEAKSFYDGYCSVTELTNEDKELIFWGAVYMQLVYMPVFGDDAVPYLWKILEYAINNKNILMAALGVKE